MQDVVGALAGILAVCKVADVALDKAEVSPLRRGDQGLDFIQVALVTGGKVIQTDHTLIEFEQGLQQVAADEAGHAGD